MHVALSYTVCHLYRYGVSLSTFEEKGDTALVSPEGQEGPTMRVFRMLMGLCLHEYVGWPRVWAGVAWRARDDRLPFPVCPTCRYALVRANAQSHVHAMLMTVPWIAQPVAYYLMQRLQRSLDDGSLATRHAQFTGAILTLSLSPVLAQLRGNWAATRLFLSTVRSTREMVAVLPTDRQERAQQRVYQMFASFCSRWEWLPLVGVRDEALSRAQAGIIVSDALGFVGSALTDDDSRTDEVVATSAGDDPVTNVSGATVHWRHQLIATVCLALSVRPDVDIAEGVWRWVLKCCVSTVVPLRVLGLKLLNSVLCIARRTGQELPSHVVATLTSEDYLRRLFQAMVVDHSCVARRAVGPWRLGAR